MQTPNNRRELLESQLKADALEMERLLIDVDSLFVENAGSDLAVRLEEERRNLRELAFLVGESIPRRDVFQVQINSLKAELGALDKGIELARSENRRYLEQRLEHERRISDSLYSALSKREEALWERHKLLESITYHLDVLEAAISFGKGAFPIRLFTEQEDELRRRVLSDIAEAPVDKLEQQLNLIRSRVSFLRRLIDILEPESRKFPETPDFWMPDSNIEKYLFRPPKSPKPKPSIDLSTKSKIDPSDIDDSSLFD